MEIYIGLAIVLILLLWVAISYNRLVLLHNRVRNNWSQVDVAMKNRFDLIPNLVETVSGYAAHERKTLHRITEMRTKYTAAESVDEKAATSDQISGALSRLMLVAENYHFKFVKWRCREIIYAPLLCCLRKPPVRLGVQESL